MSSKLGKAKTRSKKPASISSEPGIPTWLQNQPEILQVMPNIVDPWLSGDAVVGEVLLNSTTNPEEEAPVGKSKRPTSIVRSEDKLTKKTRLSSAGDRAHDLLGIPVEDGPPPSTDIPPPPIDSRARPTGAAPPAADATDDTPTPSDSGEDVIIDDCTFSDGGDCVLLEGAAATEQAAAAPFGLSELVPVSEDTVLLTTEPQFCLHVWGAYQVRVLRGAVRLHGATLTPARAHFLPVFALRVKALPALRPAKEAAGAAEAVLADQLRAEFPALPAEAAAALRRPAGCALLLRRLPSRLLELLAARHGETFAPRAGEAEDALLARTGCRLPRDAAELQRLQLNLHVTSAEWEEQVEQLAARAATGERIRVAFAGGKGVGKSTWLYYVLNSLLNTRPHVYVLDLDPGQAEFTPCACVSLLKIDTFIVGPSFTHITHPVRSVFLGEVSVANDPAGYVGAVQQLTATYRQLADTDEAPLLVNTMGWAKGLGEDLLLEAFGLVQPTDVLEIVHSRQEHVNFASPLTAARVNGAGRSWLVRRYLPHRAPDRPSVTYRHSRLTALCAATAGRQDSSLAPWMYRQLNTTAFVTSLEQPDRTLCQLTPICVPWSSLAVHVTTEQLLPQHLMHAINGTVVAMCATDPAGWLPPDDRSLFSLLPHRHGRPLCLGFGVVRGVDPDRRLLYLLTDVAGAALSAVNTLVRGPHHLLDVLPADSGLRSWTPALTRDTPHTPLAQPNQRRKVARNRPWRARGRGRAAEPPW